MKKTFTLIVVLAATINIGQAQFILTKNNMPNKFCKEYRYSDTSSTNLSTISPGSAGANQTWDLTNLIKSRLDSFIYIDPTGTPGEATFPNSNLVIKYQDLAGTGYNYNYYDNADEAFTFIGVYTSSNTSNKANLTILKFPLAYQTTYSDSSTTYSNMQKQRTKINNVVYDSTRTEMKEYSSISADGYGTVITPEKSFTNVLRVYTTRQYKVTSEIRDSAAQNWIQDSSFAPVTINFADYHWYSKDYRAAVAAVSMNNSAQPKKVSYAYYLTQLSKINGIETFGKKEMPEIIAYPNPTKQYLYIPINNLQAHQIKVFDITGRLIDCFNETLNAETIINTTSYKEGLYFYTLISNTGATLSTGKFSVVK